MEKINLVEVYRRERKEREINKAWGDMLMRADQRSKINYSNEVLPWEDCHLSGALIVAGKWGS